MYKSEEHNKRPNIQTLDNTEQQQGKTTLEVESALVFIDLESIAIGCNFRGHTFILFLLQERQVLKKLYRLYYDQILELFNTILLVLIAQFNTTES